MNAVKSEHGAWYAGSGQYEHEVPVEKGRVVVISDRYHNGSEVYRTEDGEYRFISLDTGSFSTTLRAALIRLSEDFTAQCRESTPCDILPFEVYGCDFDVPDGLVLVGFDEYDGDLADFGEVLWDSASLDS